MNRLHFLELEDQTWLPATIRNCMTDHLSFLAYRAGFALKIFSTRLGKAMQITGDTTIVELCAGGGGPSVTIAKQISANLGKQPSVILSDLYPNIAKMALAKHDGQGLVDFVSIPVDASNVDKNLLGFRLLFNSFHHLDQDTALACLANATEQHAGIAVLELVDRSLFGLFQVLLATTTVFLSSAVIRPFRWSRLAMTYLIPIIPFTVLFDGIVSCLRIYSPQELENLVAKLPENDYKWEIGQARAWYSFVRTTYLVGTPGAHLDHTV